MQLFLFPQVKACWLTRSQNKAALMCCLCQFSWCKYSRYGLFQVTNRVTSGCFTPLSPTDSRLQLKRGTTAAGPVRHFRKRHLPGTRDTLAHPTFLHLPQRPSSHPILPIKRTLQWFIKIKGKGGKKAPLTSKCCQGPLSYAHTLKKPLTCSPPFVSIGKMSLMLHAISQTSERSIFTTLSTFADSKTKDCFLQKTLGTFVGGGVGGGGGGGEKDDRLENNAGRLVHSAAGQLEVTSTFLYSENRHLLRN